MSVTLNYKTIGEGQPVMIIHGLFGSLDNWQTMARRIANEGFQVITVDLRNHGKSPHTTEMSIPLMAEDLKTLVQDQQLNNLVLLGHSMGGKAAMRFALDYPDLLEKLVVVDIAPKPYTPHHNTYFEALTNLNLSSIASRGEARDALQTSVKNKGVLQFLLKNLNRNGDGGYTWKFNLPVLYENYNKLLSGIQSETPFNKPTLFINGQLSDYITPADYQVINNLFPQSAVVAVERAGHWVHAESPDSFFATLTHFLNAEH